MRRLFRSNEHKIIGGVCGGLGEHFNIDPTWVRLGFVVLTFTHGLGLLVYIIGWIIIPRQQEGDAVVTPAPTETVSTATSSSSPGKMTSLLPGFVLITVGVLFLLRESFWWFDFDYIWPLILVVIGGALVYRGLESRRVTETEEEIVNESR